LISSGFLLFSLAMSEQTFSQAFTRVNELVENFQAGEQTYLEAKYSEAQARLDFIDKFWMALGWDVSHERERNPYEQEVKVERGVAVSNRLKKADYAFFAAPNFRDVKFYVEAKKPAKNIDNADDYFQTIRYGWSSKTPLAVLTDFEQFRVIDCRYMPNIKTAENFALKRFGYREYADEAKFREIYHLFSRESVLKGSLEDFANSLPKRGRSAKQGRLFATGIQKSVDDSFLDDLDNYRGELARSFKNKNPELDGEELTEAVTRTIDRLVFIRFLEDKLIEPETMMDKFDRWADFVRASARLNGVYNGIIFKPHFIDAPEFKADEKVFADICGELSRNDTPYYLGDIPVHILGSVYERFLGKVIVATEKRATVEEKPEVRKAGGVYYTPEYIVRYIVENTVGKIIADKTPDEIKDLRFADIACGSGSFLLGVYDSLLRYHAAFYNSYGKKEIARAAGCLENADGSFTLTVKQRREILRNNVFGVDVDAQAVEVAQLSLALKLLEDATTATARAFQPKLGEKILPDMTRNIVCGNSLIDHDILDGQLFERSEERKLNPMSYEDKFPDIMRRGGFDAIVGNPPYGAEFNQVTKDYLLKNYKAQNYQLDSYLIFLEKSINDLITPNGFWGMIIPNPWLTNTRQTNIRKFVIEQTCVHEIVHFKFPVFPKVVVDTEIVLLQNRIASNSMAKVSVFDSVDTFQNKQKPFAEILHSQDEWKKNAGEVINIFLQPEGKQLVSKLKSNTQLLENYFEINVGIKPYQVGKGVPPQTRNTVDERPFDSSHKETDLHKQYLRGKDINRYKIAPIEERFIKYGNWLAEPRPAAKFLSPEKLFMRQTGDSLISALDNSQLLCLNNMHVLVLRQNSKLNIRYFLGLINSELLNWFHQSSNPEVGEVLAEVKRIHVAQLPIRTINFDDAADKAAHDKMVALVEQMLEAKKSLQAARTDRDKSFYADRCARLDRQIDSLVFDLYGLNDAEKQIVGG
jgi:adenine-specific DNA-methyltransferase